MATTNINKTKRSTDEIINGAVNRQQSWLEKRRNFTREFLRKFNMFNTKQPEQKSVKQKTTNEKNKNTLRSYWFPMLCALLVVLIAVVVMLVKINTPVKVIAPAVPEPVIKPIDKTNSVKEITKPEFDIVRIEENGKLVIAGRTIPGDNVSVIMNNKIIATEHTNKNGEFVFAPANAYKPGNYVISLIDITKNIKSENSVFVYISERGYKNSTSLLLTKNGSKFLQAPNVEDGDLTVSKIDYLESGRLVVSGKALPKLRVSLSLNDKYLGYARVSSYKNYGLGVDVGKLKEGATYKMNVRLHDGEGNVVADIEHKFVMPNMTGANNTFYTVRRGDCLWIIARNFLRKGILFTTIAKENKIENPDLIFPEQDLKIPVK